MTSTTPVVDNPDKVVAIVPGNRRLPALPGAFLQQFNPTSTSATHNTPPSPLSWNTRLPGGRIPEGLAVRVGVLEPHLLELTAPIQLIVAGVRLFSQVFHVHADQHLPQFHKITMVFILHCKRRGRGSGGWGCGQSLKIRGDVSKILSPLLLKLLKATGRPSNGSTSLPNEDNVSDFDQNIDDRSDCQVPTQCRALWEETDKYCLYSS